MLIGAGATLVVDLWALLRRKLFGTPLPDYGLVGRWIAYQPYGKFRHDRIAATAAVRGERVIGWVAHYVIGMGFAAVLIGLQGSKWLAQPALVPAVLFGLATVAAPFLLMQPGMGAGIAASRLPRPNRARLQSLTTHGVFGVGLWASALVVSAVARA